MLSARKSIKAWFAIILLCMSLSACRQNTTTSIRIALVLGENINQETYDIFAQEGIPGINQTLAEKGKPYQLEVDMVSYSERDTFSPEGYDIVIWDGTGLSAETIEEEYMDLTYELEEGALAPLYASMPAMYWEEVRANGAIYNLVRLRLNTQSGMCIVGESLESRGIDIGDPTSMSLEEWEEQFEKLYEANDYEPFIFYLPSSDLYRCAVLDNLYCFDSAFRMITPYLGLSLQEPEAGVICVYESDYAAWIKEWWVRQWENGYVTEDMTDYFKAEAGEETGLVFMPDTRLQICYPFPVISEKNGHELYPFLNTTPIYAEVKGLESGYTLIPKTAPHLETVYQVLNDLATDEELAGRVVSIFLPLCPQVIWLDSAYESGYRWMGSTEKAKELTKKAWEMSYLAPYSDFVFDETPVKEQYEAVQKLFASFNQPDNPWGEKMMPSRYNSLEEWSSNWDANIAMLLEQMYDAGLQDIIDEANRQLGLE